MKLFKSSILAMLGCALAFTSCNDENTQSNYPQSPASPGAYFSTSQPTELFISTEATSFDVPVYRTPDAELTFEVVSYDESGLFSIPTSVTFAPGQTMTNLTIGYNPASLVEAEYYEISIALGSSTFVAENAINLSVSMQAPLTTEKFEEGVGTYYYDDFFSGIDPDLDIYWSYLPSKPNKVEWTIEHWGYDVDFNITCEDYSAVDASGNVVVEVPNQFVGYEGANGRVFVADMYHFYLYLRGIGLNVNADQFKDLSYYNKETGLFTLYVAYYLPDYNEGTNWYGDAYEYFQMNGYPDYSVSVAYDGVSIDRNGNMKANAIIECGADVSKVETVMVEGSNAQDGINAILTGASGVQEFNGATSYKPQYAMTGGGTFTIVAISFDGAGEPMEFDADTFTIALGGGGGGDDDSADWKDYGVADFCDGWIVPNFAIGGVGLDPLDWMYSVPVQKYVGTELPEGEEAYRLVALYGTESPITASGLNATTKYRNVQVNVGDKKYAGLYPQYSGFDFGDGDGEVIVMDMVGNYATQDNFSITEECEDMLTYPNIAPMVSTFEDDVITLTVPLIAFADLDGIFYGSQARYPGMVMLPDAPADVRAKFKARAVAAPKLIGAVSNAFKKVKANVKRDHKPMRKFNAKQVHKATLRVR